MLEGALGALQVRVVLVSVLGSLEAAVGAVQDRALLIPEGRHRQSPRVVVAVVALELRLLVLVLLRQFPNWQPLPPRLYHGSRPKSTRGSLQAWAQPRLP